MREEPEVPDENKVGLILAIVLFLAPAIISVIYLLIQCL